MSDICNSWGCTLPKGHNMGKADIPANHELLYDQHIQRLAFKILDGQRIDIPYDVAAEWLARAIYRH